MFKVVPLSPPLIFPTRLSTVQGLLTCFSASVEGYHNDCQQAVQLFFLLSLCQSLQLFWATRYEGIVAVSLGSCPSILTHVWVQYSRTSATYRRSRVGPKHHSLRICNESRNIDRQWIGGNQASRNVKMIAHVHVCVVHNQY